MVIRGYTLLSKGVFAEEVIMSKLKYLGTMILCGLSTFSIHQSAIQFTPMSTNQITRQAMSLTGDSLSNSISVVSNAKKGIENNA